MEIHTLTDYQTALRELKRLITTAPEQNAAIAALAATIDDYEIQAGHGPVRTGQLEV